MKKIVSFMLLLAFCLSVLPLFASADVIYEPMDSFYESHREQCRRHERNYTVAGPNGNVTVYESPESDKVQETIDNGESVYVSYVYQDDSDVLWGFYEDWENEVSGWIPMDYLDLIYDEISFREEFGHLLKEETGELSTEFVGKSIKFWKYPGSSEYLEVPFESDYAPEYHMIYTDGDGVRWGRVGYYMAIRGYWINLDAPDAEFVEHECAQPEETSAPEPSKPVEEIKPAQPEWMRTVTLVVIVAVVAVVAVTTVLLVSMKRKK